MATPTADTATFYVQDYKRLVGSVITSIAVDDADGETWIGLVCETPDGTRRVAWISRDDEGNGPGTLDIVKA